MNITCKDEILILNDVMFSDVWLCSGASNMGIPLWEVNISNAVLREIKATESAAKEATECVLGRKQNEMSQNPVMTI